MIKVQVRPNEPLEAALRRFKRQCNYAGIFRLAKKHSHHEKRSDKRRREGRERIRNIQRAMRKQMRSMTRSKRRKSKVRGGGRRGGMEEAPAGISAAVPTSGPKRPEVIETTAAQTSETQTTSAATSES
ncbi:MAG: 30S ribosomal protein S21 [Planctomycetes bacterium]|nr:30S ribosomal protein S21 [Planctomycetota bacterium]